MELFWERNIAECSFGNLPKESSAEVGGIVVSPENASKLRIEDVLHFHSVKGKRFTRAFAKGIRHLNLISSRSFDHFRSASSDSSVS